MAFRKGGDEARDAAQAAQGARFARTEYLSIEEDGQVVLRYLQEKKDWPYVDQHTGAPTKAKPADYTGNWPPSMPAVCRYDEAFGGKYPDCYICDAKLVNTFGRECKPSIRNWTLACIREEVVGTPELVAAGTCTEAQIGKRIGFTDAMREIAEVDDKGQPTGKTLQQRRIVVVNFAPSNYFNGLAAIAGAYSTCCDRDYVVKKQGKGKDVEYIHIPLAETPNLHPAFTREGLDYPATESWSRYEIAIKEQNLNLEEIIADRASDEYYARFFDPNKTVEQKGEAAAAAANRPEVPSGPPEGVDADRLAAMRQRIRETSSAGVGASEID